MKLAEIQGELALDVLADLIDPVGEICRDSRIRVAFGSSKVAAIKLMLKEHKQSVIAIMAALDCTPVEEYKVSLLSLPVKLLELLNDQEVMALFTSAAPTAQTVSGTASASAKAAK